MKLFVYTATLVVCVLSVFIYHRLMTPTQIFLMTIDQYHYIIEDTKQTVNVPVYFHEPIQSLITTSDIDRIELINDQFHMDVTLQHIEFSHQELYQEKKMDCYVFTIEIPRLGVHQLLEHLKMIVTYMDNTSLSLYLGVLEIFPSIVHQTTSWDHIEVTRHKDIMTIQSFDIKALSCQAHILFSYVYTLELSCSNQIMTATFTMDDMIFTEVPLIIQLNQEEEWIIGMKWISSQRMLQQTEGYHRAYTYYIATSN